MRQQLKALSLQTATLAVLLALAAGPARSQPARPAPPEIRRYAIEVAGLRVGTMTATRQPAPSAATDAVYTLTSDVQVKFLFYNLKIYYQVVNRMRGGQLQLSTVEAHTNQGDFASRTEWKGDHYDIVANQYKHRYRATEQQPIRYTVTELFFGEPQGQTRAYSEYFGDFFTVQRVAPAIYNAGRTNREGEYRYQNGELVMLITKNPLKNFIIRLLP